MPTEHLHEPWRSFLRDFDAQLAGSTEIHCLGGFVVAEYYGLSRPTSDVDIIQVRGASDRADRLAGSPRQPESGVPAWGEMPASAYGDVRFPAAGLSGISGVRFAASR